MKTSSINFMFLLTIPLLTSCGSQAPTSTKFEISSGFAMANNSYNSGLLVTGRKVDGTKHFTVALDDSKSRTIDLEKGDWIFSAVGWKGETDEKFDGTNGVFCGETQASLNQDAQTVSLDLSDANCSFLKVENLGVTSCGAFYEYDTSTQNYNSVSNPQTFCSTLETSLQSPYGFYRISAIDSFTNQPGLFSACKEAASANRLKLPTSTIPLNVHLYKTYEDCTANNVSKIFEFKQGITAQDRSSFDHELKPYGTTDRILLLPSTDTRRAYSPLMNLIPRITCSSGSEDCYAAPFPSGHIRVPWDDTSYRKQVLLTKANPDSCSSLSMTPNPYFSIAPETCEYDEGRVFAQLSRNELSCQEAPLANVQDVIYRDGRIFVLHTKEVSSIEYPFISVYTESGRFLSSYNLGTPAPRSMTVANDRVYIANESNPTDGVQVFQLTEQNVLTSLGSLGIANPKIIAIDETGTFLYYVPSSGPNLKSWRIANNSSQDSITLEAGREVHDLLVHNGNLFVTSTLADSGSLVSYPLTSNGMIESASAFSYSNTSIYRSISVKGSNTIGALRKDGSNNIFVDYFQIGSSTLVNSYPLPGLTATSIFESSEHIGNNSLVVGTESNLEWFQLSTAIDLYENKTQNGACLATLMTFSDSAGNTSPPLDLEAKYDESVFWLMSNLLELIGHRTITLNPKQFYYFEALHHDDEDDNYRSTGGALRQVQQMLSPAGIAAAFSEYATCTDLKTAASNGPISRSLYLMESDGRMKFFTITASLAPATAENELGAAFCNPINYDYTSCRTEKFDIILKLVQSYETMEIKLSCSQKAGRFEVVEKEGMRESRELVLWNTQDNNAARFEVYELDKEGPSTVRSKILRVLRSSDDLLVRDIHIENRSDFNRGHVREIFKEASEIKIETLQLSNSLGGLSELSGEADQNYGITNYDLYSNTSFATSYLPYQSCMTTSQTNPGAPSSSCYGGFGTWPTDLSIDVPFSLSSFDNNGAVISDFFKLPLPGTAGP